VKKSVGIGLAACLLLAITVIVGGTARSAHGKESVVAVPDNRAIARQYFDAWNNGDWAAAGGLYGPTFANLEGSRRWFAMWHTAFPDITDTIDDISVEGDKLTVRFSGGGTHRGEFQGVAATGKRVTVTGSVTWQIQDGLIVAESGDADIRGVLAQLAVH